MPTATEMSNSMLIEYMYENIENFNEFISSDCLGIDVALFLGLAQEIVQKHINHVFNTKKEQHDQ